ncbi:MAG: type I-E CRISPR-associated protein Cas6/Cse3/CasE [Thermoleophilia bacterium]
MSLYLTRLLLNPHSRRVISEVNHPYEMHRTLMRAFAGAADDTGARAQFGVLFRAETDERLKIVRVYVQSEVEPDWSFLHECNGYLLTGGEMDPCEYRDMTPALRAIQGGRVLAFRLRANPTKRVWNPHDVLRGKRVELQREEEQVAWLARKGQGGGPGVSGGFELVCADDEQGSASVPRVSVRCEGKRMGRKKDLAGGHITTHLSVVFDGLLRVTDDEAFVTTLRGGIGSAKAYGFGLLSLAPPNGSSAGRVA